MGQTWLNILFLNFDHKNRKLEAPATVLYFCKFQVNVGWGEGAKKIGIES